MRVLSALAEAFCRAVNTRQTRKVSTVEPLAMRDDMGGPSPIVSSALGQQSGRRNTPPLTTIIRRCYRVTYAQQAPVYPYDNTQPGPLQYPLSIQHKRHASRSSGFIAALVVIALLSVIGSAVFVIVSNSQYQSNGRPAPTARHHGAGFIFGEPAALEVGRVELDAHRKAR